MKIRNFRIRNYKSFADSGLVNLSPRTNVLVGQNNAGKTALLSALDLRFMSAQHRSLAFNPIGGTNFVKPSTVDFEISVSGRELAEILQPDPDVRISLPPTSSRSGVSELSFKGAYNDPKALELFWKELMALDQINFKLTRQVIAGMAVVRANPLPSHGLFQVTGGDNYAQLVRSFDVQGAPIYRVAYGAQPIDLGERIAPSLISRIYRFSAERFGLGDSQFGTDSILRSDGSNLAEALGTLQPNPALYEKFIALVTFILPQVKWISVDPDPDITGLRIKIWNLDPKLMRKDLAIPLKESGTGLGQVLSILYVAFTSESSRVFLIDEPQSFLHPGAARKLIEVLSSFSHHQYIISTHSSAMLSAADPDEVIVLKINEGQSQVELANAKSADTLRAFLEETGTRLADVFGMDRVVWVEGPTEVKAYPILLSKLGLRDAGTAIVSIRNTGDLEGKDARKMFEIYQNLTAKSSILPPTIGFILDSETFSEVEKAELSSLSLHKAKFSPRRTFENFLLNEEAICEVINSIDGFSLNSKIELSVIRDFLAEKIALPKYWAPLIPPPNPALNYKGINGALLLKDLFTIMSEARVEYQKTTHSISLFTWMVDKKPNELDDLADFLITIFATTPAIGNP